MMDIDNLDGQDVQVINSNQEQNKADEEVFDLDDLDDDNMFAKPASS
jgi:hypothetical protein